MKKNMLYSFIAIVFIAILVQFVRSDQIIGFINNTNSIDIEVDAININNKIQVPLGIKKDKYLIIYDEDEGNSVNIKENTVQTLKYLKKDYEVLEKDDEININIYSTIILTLERLDYINNIDTYIDYVNRGGNLVFLERPMNDENFNRIYKKLGIEKMNGINDMNLGIKLVSNIIIGANGYNTNEEIIVNSSLDIDINTDAKEYIKSYNGSTLLYKYNHGEGNIVFFNGTMLNEKVNRGLIVGILSIARDDFIYPIINSKNMYIDDFPAPIPTGIIPEIYEEYSRETDDFFREIWWSDMVRISEKYDIKYTGMIIQTYNDRVSPPFRLNKKNNSDSKKNLIIYGRELIRMGGELGIHGYNHQSLAIENQLEGYNSWASKEDMKLAIREVVRFTNNIYENYNMRVYVPPSNILSSYGREAIIEEIPDLKVIGSLYTGNDLSYVQEFEFKDGIVEMPRFSAGYIDSDENTWSIINAINTFGMFSHFIHPDDVLDIGRNEGKSWSGLSRDIDSMIGRIDENYPWLISMTASQAGRESYKYINIKPFIQYNDNSIDIYCQDFIDNSYFIMRSDKVIEKSVDYNIISIDEGVYLIELKVPVTTIKFTTIQK